ncbi:hypothetical protein KAX29_01175, partial [candidate division WOR-3 bacterium]|nr:hypothetical protein [candidate division WOR-3 bacterium]
PYVYCNNDPLNFVDPWGLDQEAWSWWTDYDNKECGSEGVEIVGSRGGGGWSYDYMDSHDDAFIYVIERNRHDVPHGGGDRYHRGGGRGGSGRGGGGGGVPYWRPRPKSVIERMIEGIENYAESFFSLEGGWNNLNFAGIGQYFIGGTFGVLWTDNSLHLELGLIAGSPGASLGLTRSTDALTPGFHSAAQIYKGLATFQSGTYIRSQSNWFEAGLGIPSTGLSGWGGVIFVTPALISW